jgi:hypothetical protein
MWIFLEEKSTQQLRLRSTPFPKTLYCTLRRIEPTETGKLFKKTE